MLGFLYTFPSLLDHSLRNPSTVNVLQALISSISGAAFIREALHSYASMASPIFPPDAVRQNARSTSK